MSVSRRGFSLIEVMIALVVAALLSTLAAEITVRLQKVGRARSERSGAAASLRLVSGVLRRELLVLGVDSVSGADHGASSPSSITFRAERGLWAVCRVAADTIVLAADRLASFRARLPVPGRDSLLLYLPGDSIGAIDAWLPLPLGPGPLVTTCPAGSAGFLFETTLDSIAIARFRITPTGVARLFETDNARLYLSGPTPSLGFEELSAGATIQPVAGPLLAGIGIELTGWTRASGLAGSATTVADFELVVRASSGPELAVGPGQIAPISDSVRTLIPLRNAP